MQYPFEPKSTSFMKAGQFWPIALSNGKFGCGMVLDIVPEGRRSFLAGLLDWCGEREPTAEDLVGCELLAQGEGNIQMILESHGSITGEVAESEVPTPITWMEHRGGRDYGLYQGLELVQIVDAQTAEAYPRRKVWGVTVIQVLAEAKLTEAT